ncbi:hypothetical protein ACHAWO_011105 [Cyclotella atomus]|uniref:RING-type domain-containing protein n=1 Tax=Cyclotella atomus TaxID=382360 RepID=A0ABD3MPC0_9STRA
MFVRMLRRPRHHHGHERVSLQETNDTDGSDVTDAEIQRQDAPSIVANQAEQLNPASDAEHHAHSSQPNNENTTEYNADEPSSSITVHPRPTTHPFLTSQISVERSIRHRRQSTCTLLLLFLLFRLWVEAILQKDIGLLFLSTMGTTWTYRYWCSHREVEQEYDRQIEENQRSGTNNNTASNTNEVGDAASTFDPDLGLMSFQAQLALAILESQRQMFENGGYGGNDNGGHDGPGVTEEARGKWKRYEWGGEGCSELRRLASNNSMEALGQSSLGNSISSGDGNAVNYGSVGSEEEEEVSTSASKLEEGLVLSMDEEEPSCSICLCEYEMGESVMRLPCNHIYHESCLDSWVTNHVRCPLCNFDLMEGFEAPPRPPQQQQQHQNNNAELFRMMMGARRATRTARSTRRQLATMLAAMEDSVV